MADKPLKSITFPGLPDKYMIPEIDSTLTQQGEAADAKKTGDEISDLKNTLNHKADAIYDTASGDIASFPDGADGLPVKDLTVGIEFVQSGTGDPSPTNVRPISGCTGCNVTRTGKNLFNKDTLRAGDYNGSTPSIRVSQDIKDRIPAIKGITYTCSFTPYNNCKNQWIILTDSSNNNVQTIVAKYPNTFTFTVDKDNTYITLIYSGDNTGGNWESLTVDDVKNANPQVEFGSTATAYEPFGTTIPISWQSEAGTVYGGTLDVTTGVLTVDRAYETITSDSAIDVRYPNAVGKYDLQNGAVNDTEVCDKLKHVSLAWVDFLPTDCEVYNNTFNFGFPSDGDVSPAAAKAYLNTLGGLTFTYELATPQTYQLDPVTVTTLLGQNNVWSDTGAVLNCEYPADTKLYIDKKLSALVAALS